MLLQYSENKRDMQIKRQIFSIINRKRYLCIENRKGCPNSILITKSNNQLVQCSFSDYCLEEFARIGKKVNGYNLHILHKPFITSLYRHCLN